MRQKFDPEGVVPLPCLRFLWTCDPFRVFANLGGYHQSESPPGDALIDVCKV